MEHIFYGFWWLIFPIMGFAFGGFGMWMGYKAQRDRMELAKALIAQGKDPDEVSKILNGAGGSGNVYIGGNHPGAWGGPGPWGASRWGYWGPMREWRRFVTFACLSAGFGFAAWYDLIPGTYAPFGFVAVIMGVLALGSLLFAIIASVMAAKTPTHEK